MISQEKNKRLYNDIKYSLDQKRVARINEWNTQLFFLKYGLERYTWILTRWLLGVKEDKQDEHSSIFELAWKE